LIRPAEAFSREHNAGIEVLEPLENDIHTANKNNIVTVGGREGERKRRWRWGGRGMLGRRGGGGKRGES